MATGMIFRFRRKTAADWTTANPVLQPGEMGLEKDTGYIKFGNDAGADWVTLAYAFAGGGGGGGGVWGSITGTLASQADLVAALAAKAAVAHTHIATAISDSTSFGRDLLTAASVAAQRTALGLASVASVGTFASLTGIPATFAPSAHTHPGTDISDSTAAGRSMLAAANAAAQKTLLAIAQADVASLVSDLALKAPLAAPTFTGIPAAPTAGGGTNTTQIATTAFVTSAVAAIIAAADAMVFQGVIDCSTNPNYPAADRGWVYKITVAGKIGGAAGPNVEVGDTLLCQTDGTAAGNHATVGAAWNITQGNLDGAVIGPAAVTAGNPVLFSGTSGRLVAETTFPSFKTSLAITTADVSGLGALATLSTLNLSTLATGTLQAAQAPAHTGDVTSTAGSLALAIAANAVTLAHMAQVATNRFLGRTTAGTGNVEVLSAAQATAMINLATVSNSGAIPATGVASGLFLKDDMTWAATPGGVGAPGGSSTQVQYNNAGSFAGAAGVEIEAGQLRLIETTTFTTPADNGLRLIALERDGKTSQPAWLGQDGAPHVLMESLAQSNKAFFLANPGSTTNLVARVAAPTAVGTATAFNPTTASLYTKIPVLEYLVTVAATTAVAGFRTLNGMMTVGGGSAGKGGLFWFGRFGPATGVATATARCAFGIRALTTAPSDVNPSQLISGAFFGWDDADTNMQFMSNDASGACAKVDLGASFSVPAADRTKAFDCFMYSPAGTTQELHWRIVDLATLAEASGVVTTAANLPAVTSRQSPFGYCSVGGTSSVIGFGLMAMEWGQIVVD